MKSLSKVLPVIGILLIMPIGFDLWLRHEKVVEINSVDRLLRSSPQWSRVHVRGAGGWRVVVEGVVSNETELKELRAELHDINSKKTAVLVRVQE